MAGGKSKTCYGPTIPHQEDVDIPGVTAFVCLLYDIVEARYKAFMRMSDIKEETS